MGRKLFHGINSGAPSTVVPDTATLRNEDSVQPRIRSARALRGGLMEMSANSVRDLDTAAIIDDGLNDRLGISDESIQDLAESIRVHGQQVPILVRPTNEPDSYRVVYGRRRLAAARQLGIPVKALVRTLDDMDAIIAQGQENSLRLNPSFVEKAVFVGAMRDALYDSSTIQDALGINRQTLSLLTIVQQYIPMEVIEAIGPAHEIGRRPWMQLAYLSRDSNINLIDVLSTIRARLEKETSSDRRFALVSRAANATRSDAKEPKSATVALRTEDGDRLGTMMRKGDELHFVLSANEAPDFCTWVEAKATTFVQQLYSEWLTTQSHEE